MIMHLLDIIHRIPGRGPSSSTLRFPPHPHQQQHPPPSDPHDLASMARVPSPMQPLAHNLYTSYTQPEHGGYGGYTQPEHGDYGGYPQPEHGGYGSYHQPEQEIRSYNQDQEMRGYNHSVQETRGYGHPDQERQERPASIWSRFPSLPQQQQTVAAQVHSSTTGTLTRHNNNNHNLQLFHCAAELPRPTATVKPLTPPMSAAVAVVCDLPEPELGCGGPDLNMPFANEHRGTIRLKTNPAEVFAEYEQQQHHHQHQHQHQQPPAADGGCGATKDELNDSGKSLLRTPTRAPNRSATDVMEDISSMLADLTTELDSMLTSDSVQ